MKKKRGEKSKWRKNRVKCNDKMRAIRFKSISETQFLKKLATVKTIIIIINLNINLIKKRKGNNVKNGKKKYGGGKFWENFTDKMNAIRFILN